METTHYILKDGKRLQVTKEEADEFSKEAKKIPFTIPSTEQVCIISSILQAFQLLKEPVSIERLWNKLNSFRTFSSVSKEQFSGMIGQLEWFNDLKKTEKDGVELYSYVGLHTDKSLVEGIEEKINL